MDAREPQPPIPLPPESALDERTLRALLPRIGALRKYVVRKIPKRFQSRISADDVLQDVWVVVCHSGAQIEMYTSDALERWLMSIANSKLVDAIRSARTLKRGHMQAHQHRDRMTSLTDLLDRVNSPLRTPSSELHCVETAHALSLSLHHLRGERRRAIEMAYMEGLSREAIAQALGKSESAVNTLLYNGLRQLRRVLGDAARYLSDASLPPPVSSQPVPSLSNSR